MDTQVGAQGDKALDTLFSISKILDTGLDRETLRILVGLCETGISPEALALVVKELRREAAAIKAGTQEAAAPGCS
jgi:mitotic-spindle organizing protein 1